MAIEVTGSSSTIVFEPLPVDDPTQRQPDITTGPPAARVGADDPAARRGSSAPPSTSAGLSTGPDGRPVAAPSRRMIDVSSPLQGTIVSLEVPAGDVGRPARCCSSSSR